MKNVIVSLGLIFGLFFPQWVHAAAGDVDLGFNPNASGVVYSLAVESSGKMLLGGRFTTVGNARRDFIAHLNADGTLDSAFNLNADGSVYSMAIQSDGKILLGGIFRSMGGATRTYIARLNADRTLDSEFNPNASSIVNSLAVQPDGKILLGGSFDSVGGTTRNHIARLNGDGTLDTAFNPNANGTVLSVALQADGKILLGGGFTSVSGATRNNIARLNGDGTLDTAFNPNASSSVDSIALQADGKIVLGGDFTSVGATTRNRIARLNANGTLDSAFNPNAEFIVESVALQSDGKILLEGDFISVGGTPRNNVARLLNEPATQTLEKPDATKLRWLRGGTAPEIEQVVFEQFNGSSWSPLGAGTRISGGWEKTGLSLPADGFVRARGISRGGYFNGSGGIIEQVLSFGAVPNIGVLQADGLSLTNGLSTASFGTLDLGQTSAPVVLTITNSGTATLSLASNPWLEKLRRSMSWIRMAWRQRWLPPPALPCALLSVLRVGERAEPRYRLSAMTGIITHFKSRSLASTAPQTCRSIPMPAAACIAWPCSPMERFCLGVTLLPWAARRAIASRV